MLGSGGITCPLDESSGYGVCHFIFPNARVGREPDQFYGIGRWFLTKNLEGLRRDLASGIVSNGRF